MLPGHNRKMTGAQCIADMLKGYGVTHVFHVPAVMRTAFAEMERRTEIKRLHVHGEKSAAYMADGYARASGKPGICGAQVIGALNLAAGPARRLARPFAGDRHDRRSRSEDEIPQGLSGGRRRAGVRAGDQVQRHRRRRGAASRHGAPGVPHGGRPACPGPVHLQFRGNEGQLDAEEAEMEPLVEPQFARVPAFRPEPDAASVQAALKILQAAARPVIVAGGGVRASGARPGARRARRSFANPGRDFAQRQGFHTRQSSAVGWRRRLAIRAKAPTASSTRPISSVSSAARPAA